MAVRSEEIVPKLLYETRVRFVDQDKRHFQIIGDLCTENAEVFGAAV